MTEFVDVYVYPDDGVSEKDCRAMAIQRLFADYPETIYLLKVAKDPEVGGWYARGLMAGPPPAE
jgi:hypothetical protein